MGIGHLYLNRGFESALHLVGECVFLVLGFPIAAREIECVEESPVNTERIALFAGDGVLGNDCPLKLAGAVFEQVLKGSADVALFVEMAAGEAIESGVVLFDRRAGGLEVECGLEGFSVCKDSAGRGEATLESEGGELGDTG